MRIYRQKGYTIRASKDLLGTHNKLVTILTVSIKNKESEAKYIVISMKGSMIPYSTMKNILINPDYRKQFLVVGYTNCEEVFSYVNKHGVNLDCKKAILAFNKKARETTVTKQDYNTLKTYGTDIFSGLTTDELMSYRKIAKRSEEVRKVFASEEHIVSTFKWILRGLSVHHAIQRELLTIVTDNAFRDRFVIKHLDDSLQDTPS